MPQSDIYYTETKYGFQYGSLEVERRASLEDGSVVVSVYLAGRREECIDICCSPEENRIRLFKKDRELKW